MSKKRKTRQEKIILQLKRELAIKKAPEIPDTTESKSRQGAILNEAKFKPKVKNLEKKPNNTIFSYNPRLIKKDLAKTAAFTLIALSLELMLYLKLR